MPISLQTYKIIRENKKNIIKNYHFREAIGYIEQDQYNNFSDQREAVISDVNEDSKLNVKNVKLYREIVVLFNKALEENVFSDIIDSKLISSIVDTLICYTPDYSLKLNALGKNREKREKRERLLELYESIYNRLGEEVDDPNEEFDELLITMAQRDTHICDDGMSTINVKIVDLKKKIESREMYLGKINGYNETWYFSIYDELVFYFTPEGKTKMQICINYKINTENEYSRIIEFISEEYSPIRDSMEDDKNLPSETYSNVPLTRRKSITLLDSIQYKDPENGKVGKLGNFTPTEYFKDPVRTKFQVKEIMQCFRNDRKNSKDPTSKIMFNQSEANFRREPFLKHVLNFPPMYKGNGHGKENICETDLKLVHKIRLELNNILFLIKQKYPPPKDKQYFLIDLAGGGGKHFDYSLYAFSEKELQKPQDTFLVKKNLWKKLEFKSIGKAHSINDLTLYLSKAPDTLFDTANLTFAGEFKAKTQSPDKVKRNRLWIREAVTSEYFTKAIENILKGQKDKIYIIWSVRDKRIFLDEFLPEELIVKRENGVPQIVLDEDLLKQGKIRLRVRSESSTDPETFTHEITLTETKKGASNYSFRFKLIRKGSVFYDENEDEDDSDMDVEDDEDDSDMDVDEDLSDTFGNLRI